MENRLLRTQIQCAGAVALRYRQVVVERGENEVSVRAQCLDDPPCRPGEPTLVETVKQPICDDDVIGAAFRADITGVAEHHRSTRLQTCTADTLRSPGKSEWAEIDTVDVPAELLEVYEILPVTASEIQAAPWREEIRDEVDHPARTCWPEKS